MIVYVCITIGVIIVYSVLSVIIISYYHRHTASALNKINRVINYLDRIECDGKYKYSEIDIIRKKTVNIQDYVINYNREIIKRLNEIQDKVDIIYSKKKFDKAKNSLPKSNANETTFENNKLNKKPKKAIKDNKEASQEG